MKFEDPKNVGVIVNDLSAAKEFFLDFGLEVKGEWEMEEELMGYAVGLNDVKVACVGLGTPDGQTWIELIKFYKPSDESDIQQTFANTLGIRHIAFTVEDIEAVVAKLKKNGTEIFSELQHYEESYKLCYVRGPEGIILELAEEIK
ncbi:VOC family protein [Bacillus sp. DTU_2020_1000418_1_SI_GHA_SEK_038]|uniref:VOC family protein n=1 Tax=Bacillus sp. DTU_2020_1000418_1_SI_GHA_SEK_038 TaxID=3077585 RepID=UPI0028EEF69C|nr:VOC family protein [Bacillus sp. DTU_2020_1000418_1_SI_GHA_SEK_038]WNS76154.1 VOC family protein [Bacillus sp. DTU_2020_1000418_1_SI_GHA_SEK_038]